MCVSRGVSRPPSGRLARSEIANKTLIYGLHLSRPLSFSLTCHFSRNEGRFGDAFLLKICCQEETRGIVVKLPIRMKVWINSLIFLYLSRDLRFFFFENWFIILKRIKFSLQKFWIREITGSILVRGLCWKRVSLFVDENKT